MCFSHYYAKIKVNSYDSLSLEETLTLHNVIILIKSVLNNKDQNHYYYNIFLEKCLYQLAKKIMTKQMPKMSRYVRTFKVKDKSKLMSFCIDAEKLLENFKNHLD